MIWSIHKIQIWSSPVLKWLLTDLQLQTGFERRKKTQYWLGSKKEDEIEESGKVRRCGISDLDLNSAHDLCCKICTVTLVHLCLCAQLQNFRNKENATKSLLESEDSAERKGLVWCNDAGFHRCRCRGWWKGDLICVALWFSGSLPIQKTWCT